MRFLASLLVLLVLAGPAVAQPPPVIDQLTSPFTDSELGGVGCLTASTLTAGTLVYLLGGFRRIAMGMQGVIPTARVMEGTAAAAFIFSSACYVGAALAPVAMMLYTSIADRSFLDSSPAIITSGSSVANGGMAGGGAQKSSH